MPGSKKKTPGRTMSPNNEPLRRLPDEGDRIDVTGTVEATFEIASDWPQQKGLITDGTRPEDDRVAFLLSAIPEGGALEVGDRYVFENVRVNRAEGYPFAPQDQIIVDDYSKVRPVSDTGTDDNDDPDRSSAESGSDSHDPADCVKPTPEVTVDQHGERVTGHNPFANPGMIKDAGLHQGGM